MSDTRALDVEYARVIPARFVTKRDGSTMACMTCGNPLVMGEAFAAQAQVGWHSYCARCAASEAAQIAGLVRRIEALVVPLGANVPADITAMVATAEPTINKVMGQVTVAPTDFLAAKRQLLIIRAAVGAAKAATLPAPIRTNSYGGKCGKCGVWVDHGKGRIEKLGNRWQAYHLDDQCPAPQAVAPTVTLAEGLYKHDDGTIRKVYKTRNERLGVKNLHIFAMGKNKDGSTKYKGSFRYSGGGIKNLAEAIAAGTAHPLTEAEASAFGMQYSFCVNCSLYLDDDRSLAAGYGSTCAKNKGWRYPTYEEAAAILGRPAGPNSGKIDAPQATVEAPQPTTAPQPIDTATCEYCDEDIRIQYTLDSMEQWRDMWVDHMDEATCSGDDASGPNYEHKPLVENN